jgi:hypothetical protein
MRGHGGSAVCRHTPSLGLPQTLIWFADEPPGHLRHGCQASRWGPSSRPTPQRSEHSPPGRGRPHAGKPGWLCWPGPGGTGGFCAAPGPSPGKGSQRSNLRRAVPGHIRRTQHGFEEPHPGPASAADSNRTAPSVLPGYFSLVVRRLWELSAAPGRRAPDHHPRAHPQPPSSSRRRMYDSARPMSAADSSRRPLREGPARQGLTVLAKSLPNSPCVN